MQSNTTSQKQSGLSEVRAILADNSGRGTELILSFISLVSMSVSFYPLFQKLIPLRQ